MLTYDLAGRGHMPLYEALCRCIRADIWAGRLAPGTQLPSRRALAQHLGISIVTVESAYAQLVDEGCDSPAAPRLLCGRGGAISCAGVKDAVLTPTARAAGLSGGLHLQPSAGRPVSLLCLGQAHPRRDHGAWGGTAAAGPLQRRAGAAPSHRRTPAPVSGTADRSQLHRGGRWHGVSLSHADPVSRPGSAVTLWRTPAMERSRRSTR